MAGTGAESARAHHDQLARAALEGNPWQFVPLAQGLLRQSPADGPLWLLLARAFGRLGLRTPGLAALDRASRAGAEAGALDAARRALQALPDDRVDPAHRAATCRANLAAIGARGGLPADLDAQVAAWEAGLGASRAYRAASGSVVVESGEGGDAAWTHWLDDVAMARGFTGAGLTPQPLCIDGVHAPALIRQIAAVTAAAPGGARTRLTLLAATAAEFLDGLSLADLRDVLADDRVECHVGADVPARLAALWEGAPQETTGLVIGVPMPPRPAERWPRGAVAAVLERVTAARERLAADVRRDLERLYAPRDSAWWLARLEAARAGTGPALRVLIPTTRYSTFIQHSAEDFAAALRLAGCEARVLIEPGDTVQHSALALPLAIAAYGPDVVVLINLTRACAAGAIPANLPVVTWCQDTMAHLFDEKRGRSVGARDLFCGHMLPQLFDQFGYPRSRSLATTVVASAQKFHDGPVAPALREAHACDIAYVSHQSEPVPAMRDRLISEARAAGDGALARIIAEVYDEVVALGGSAASGPRVDYELDYLSRRAVRRVMGDGADPRIVTAVQFTIVRPLAERVVRHQMLAWASEIAGRRGWSMHLYGNGWERHPTLAAHARGPLPHDEALRASYQSARVHLHASINGHLHQRVVECALSGGLPLVRVNHDVLAAVSLAVSRRVSLRQDPQAQAVSDRSCWMYIERDPEAMRLVPLMAAWGLVQYEAIQLFPELRTQAGADGGAMVPSEGAAWLLGPTCDIGFDSAETLERAIERPVTVPAWREARSAAVREVVRSEFTHDVLARRVLAALERGAVLARGRDVVTAAGGGR